MGWVWQRDVDAVRAGLLGRGGHGGFDDGVEKLVVMLTRWDRSDPYTRPRRVAVSYGDVRSCAAVLVALEPNPDTPFAAGVVATALALLPSGYWRPGGR